MLNASEGEDGKSIQYTTRAPASERARDCSRPRFWFPPVTIATRSWRANSSKMVARGVEEGFVAFCMTAAIPTGCVVCGADEVDVVENWCHN